ncbi:MAG TPA: UvrD-helicase domain-containing protein [Micropruina sp.]|nr:UvrD-helicase domain-containing protein [Micropruina sp.]
MDRFDEFDPRRPLGAGTTVLEASAGTGKTHAIADVAVTLLGAGSTTVNRLLLVTFGRDATRELRSRVREHLLKAVAGATDAGVRANLQRAVAGFDTAAVMTIHEFCQSMYTRLGVLATSDPSGTLLPDLRPLVREVAVDEYLRRYAFAQRRPPIPLTDRNEWDERNGADRLARDAVENALRTIVPADAPNPAAERIRFAEQVRATSAERRHRLGVLTFDDQLLRLQTALADPITGADACRRLRGGVDYVLVDEFQDTDPVQWEILWRLFDGHRPMVLIGDPKQAIYTFRGADVQAYLRAADGATERFGLSRNYRSDAALVSALGTLFEGLRLGDGIDVRPVSADRPACGLRHAGEEVAPVVLTTIDQQQKWTHARDQVVADVAGQVRALLEDHELFDEDLPGGPGWRPVDPGDIAVLVRTNPFAQKVADALRARGVPVALSGAESIFSSPAAKDWLSLLRALASGWRGDLRKAVRTAFFEASLADLASADEQRVAGWTATLRQWDRILHTAGVAALFAAIGAETDFIDRVLARPDGERLMTDFRHVAELLHEASGHERPSATWLAEWLAEQLKRPAAESERTRRLETDSRAVQVKTVHRAKGLQYPIVLLPDLWKPFGSSGDDGGALLFHDEQGRAVVDLGGIDAPGRADRYRRARLEDDEEELRLLYVAFTRARCQVRAWWARTEQTADSALQRVLYRARGAGASVPAARYPLDVPPGTLAPGELDWLRGTPGIEVRPIELRTRPPAPPAARRPPALRALGFGRSIDADWRRTSYSGLTAGVHHDAPLLLDEPEEPQGAAPSGPAATPSPMRDLPGGTQFGTLVHALFEQVDPGPDPGTLRGNLARAAAEWLPRFPLPGVAADQLVESLLPAFATPLGPLADGRSLAELPLADRLAELTFDLPMEPAAPLTLGDIATLLHRQLPADDPLVGYPALLADPALAGQPLRGFLTGSIDAVLRVGDPQRPRFLVVDYKTNRLGGDDLTLGHYAQGPMVTAMCASHYPLQALLYCVALHRFLAGRLAGYQPERHLGGVLYLFVRGMGGVDAGPETGVFAWNPPAALVAELSRLLGGGATDA